MLGTGHVPKVVMWNINCLDGYREYFRTLLNEENPGLVILSETNMKRPLILHVDIGVNTYKSVQIRSSAHARGGMVVLIKLELKLITAKIIREKRGDNFVHATMFKDKNDEALVGTSAN